MPSLQESAIVQCGPHTVTLSPQLPHVPTEQILKTGQGLEVPLPSFP
jgi:hypothetical protein